MCARLFIHDVSTQIQSNFHIHKRMHIYVYTNMNLGARAKCASLYNIDNHAHTKMQALYICESDTSSNNMHECICSKTRAICKPYFIHSHTHIYRYKCTYKLFLYVYMYVYVYIHTYMYI
jgi:hypothetical protein